MATIFKKPGSPFWYARFQVEGKDYALSTKKTNKNDATTVMRHMVQEYKGTLSIDEAFESLMSILLKRAKEEKTQQGKVDIANKRHELARRLSGAQEEKIVIADAWQAWMNSPMKRNPGKVTIGCYKGQWERFKTWIEKQGVQYLHDVTPANVENYSQQLWESGVSPGTFNAHIKFLKSMFRVLKVRAGLVSNPWDQIPMKELERESRRNFTPEELKAVCGNATGNLRYIIGMGLYTGMRLGDVLNLRWEDVRFKEGFIEHIPSKTARKKKKIRLPIHPVMEVLLKELRATSKGEFLLPEERALYKYNHSAITKQIQAFFKSCGIITQEQATNGHRRKAIVRIGFHSLRHSFVSLCAANMVPQVVIQELVGHGSPAMTALYSHAGDKQKTAAIATLPTMKFLPEKKGKNKS